MAKRRKGEQETIREGHYGRGQSCNIDHNRTAQLDAVSSTALLLLLPFVSVSSVVVVVVVAVLMSIGA